MIPIVSSRSGCSSCSSNESSLPIRRSQGEYCENVPNHIDSERGFIAYICCFLSIPIVICVASRQAVDRESHPAGALRIGNVGLFCGFLGLSQQRRSLDRGTEPFGKNSQPAFEEDSNLILQCRNLAEMLKVAGRPQDTWQRRTLSCSKVHKPEPRRYVTLRWTSALVAALLLGMCLRPRP
jgi:hypothetical protein